MKVGQRVQWQSQGRGSWITKVGKVVRILRKREIPYKVACREYPNHQLMFDGFELPGGKKADYAYFVEVIKSLRAKPRLYMPFPYKLMIFREKE